MDNTMTFDEAFDKLLEVNENRVKVKSKGLLPYEAVAMQSAFVDKSNVLYVNNIKKLEMEVKNAKVTGIKTIFLSPSLFFNKENTAKILNIVKPFKGKVFFPPNAVGIKVHTVELDTTVENEAGIMKRLAENEYSEEDSLSIPALTSLTGYSFTETLVFLKSRSMLSESGKRFYSMLEKGDITIEQLLGMTAITIVSFKMKVEPDLSSYTNIDKGMEKWFASTLREMMQENLLNREEAQYEKREQDVVYHIPEKREEQENRLFNLVFGIVSSTFQLANTKLAALASLWKNREQNKGFSLLSRLMGGSKAYSFISSLLTFGTVHSSHPQLTELSDKGLISESSVNSMGWFAVQRAANMDMGIADRFNSALAHNNNEIGR